MRETPDGPLLALGVFLAVLGWVVWLRLQRVTIGSGEIGLLYRRGSFRRLLRPGRHLTWSGEVRRVTIQPQTLHVRSPEVATRDHMPLRLTAVVTFRVAPENAREVLERDVLNPVERVRHATQFALMGIIDSYTLADLLDARPELDEALAAGIAEFPPQRGVEIQFARVRDFILHPVARRHLIATTLDRPPPAV